MSCCAPSCFSSSVIWSRSKNATMLYDLKQVISEGNNVDTRIVEEENKVEHENTITVYTTNKETTSIESNNHVKKLSTAILHSVNDSGGQVFWAKDRITGEDVAIKVISKHVFKHDKLRKKKIKHEIRMLSKLRHPNIIRLFGVYESSNTFEVVFELSKGGEVMKRIVSPYMDHYQFSEEEVSRIVREVISAIDYMHSQGIVHGDIRPEHILYSTTDPDSKVILVDFGRSCPYSAYMTLSNRKRRYIEKLSDRIESLRYINPPRLTKEKLSMNEAFQIDIWALGVIIFMMLCGSYPFEGETKKEVIENILRGRVAFPQEIDPYISRAAKDLVCRMLDKDADTCLKAKDVAQHPWVADGTASTLPFSYIQVKKMKSFVETRIDVRGSEKLIITSTVASPSGTRTGSEFSGYGRRERMSIISTDGVAIEDKIPKDFSLIMSPDSIMKRAETEIAVVSEKSKDLEQDERKNNITAEEKNNSRNPSQVPSRKIWKMMFQDKNMDSFLKKSKIVD